jgi:hypothetical protein
VRAAARKMAAAIRHGAARDAERRGTGRHRATVLDTSPLRLDLHGSDLQLDNTDVTLGKSVVTAGFAVNDVLVLIEVDDAEWIAVDVET